MLSSRSPAYEVADYSTVRDSPEVRFEAWTDHVRENHGGLTLTADARPGFTGRTRVQRAADCQIVAFESDAITYRREAAAARRDGDDTIRVLLPNRGVLAVESGDAQAIIRPGQAIAVSMAASFAVAHRAGTQARVLSFPIAQWPRLPDPRAPHMIDLTGGPGAVVVGLVDDLLVHRRKLDAPPFLDSFELAVRLLARLATGGSRPGLFDLATELIGEYSDDPDLTPADLAGRLGWSLRALQSAARAHGTTPTAMIRSARIGAARTRLRDARWADRGVADIAHASGFGSLGAFYGAFATTGERPGDLR
ncbi:AraC family transcriptional regulator [Gordonia caeni]|uniref:AraC family transcriptional regulator n=1 Tax=Gordonia caeni TaxID=1007097 RepID=A0ABP7NT95_9ACTN